MDTLGTHGLSCHFSAGRLFRHAMILHRALSSANVPSRLEPTGLDRADGKHPNGITMVPWSNGRLLVWDATCVDTFATSHHPSQPLKYVQQQTRRSRPRSRNAVTSPPMRTILSHLLPLESAALAPCLSCQTWVTALQTPPVTKALWHTSCKGFLLPFRGAMLHLFWELRFQPPLFLKDVFKNECYVCFCCL